MINSLHVNQLSAEATSWYVDEYLSAMDALDIKRYATFLADDVSVQFNNASPVTGKANVVGMLGSYWQSFRSIEHELLNIFGAERAFMLEALNHYVRHDGKTVTIRAVAITERNEAGLVKSVRIYSDTSPVFT